jgi:hypothetical protein
MRNMPGFTAGKSLGPTIGQYHTGTSLVQPSGGVQPAGLPVVVIPPLVAGGVIAGGVLLVGGEIFLILYWNSTPPPPPPTCQAAKTFFLCEAGDHKCRHDAIEYCVDHGCGHTYKTDPNGNSTTTCV